MMSGLVCKMMRCDFGCRGTGGNSCPSGLYCSSTTNAIGMCSSEMPDAGTPDAGTPDAGAPPPPSVDAGHLAPGGKLGGSGCNCQIGRGSPPSAAGALLLFGLIASLRWRRRSRR
jgi:MYXO-CTERM domain-containing protein